MANISSAGKRARQSIKRRELNRAGRSRVTTARRNAFAALKKADKEAAVKELSSYTSTLDKAVKKGVIKANTADRRKARMAQRIKALG